MENNIDKHLKIKKKLKIIGIILIVVGLGCVIAGFIDIARAANSYSAPKLFFLLIIGFPLLFGGIACTLWGFAKEMARYAKNESVPIFNEAGQEMSTGLQGITHAVKQGLKDEEKIICECGQQNDKGSNFCSGCGRPLSKKCPNCGNVLEQDDKFCSKCGKEME